MDDCPHTDLVDVTHIRLADLRALENPALARAIQRILDDIDRSQGAVAGWQSAI